MRFSGIHILKSSWECTSRVHIKVNQRAAITIFTHIVKDVRATKLQGRVGFVEFPQADAAAVINIRVLGLLRSYETKLHKTNLASSHLDVIPSARSMLARTVPRYGLTMRSNWDRVGASWELCGIGRRTCWSSTCNSVVGPLEPPRRLFLRPRILRRRAATET